jgi:hypothetical protein
MGFALPVTKGASDALFVVHATPSLERANQANHREIRAIGVSSAEGVCVVKVIDAKFADSDQGI